MKQTDLIGFFKKLEEYFPYSTMNADFKGHHSLTFYDDAVHITVWYKDKMFSIKDTELDPIGENEEWFISFKKFIIGLCLQDDSSDPTESTESPTT